MSQPTIIQKISKKVLQPKKNIYSEQPILSTMIYMDDYQVVDSSVYNKYNEKLKVSLFFHRETKHEKCIIYMHGYGSNRLQSIFILKYLHDDLSLCCFDFSGEGKSQGNVVTFGIKQKDDIRAVLGYLRTCGYKKFVLWGRSMGATCSLLFSTKQKPTDVILQILDSPFISFTQAAIELTKKRINIPQILLKFALQKINQTLSTQQYNPFQIDLNKPIHCPIPTIFVYSQNDQIINPNNSRKIINNFIGYYQKIIINQTHNAMRSSATIADLFNIIKKYMGNKIKKQIVQESGKRMMINSARNRVKQYDFQQSNHNNSNCYSNGKRNNVDNYGIWVTSKYLRQHPYPSIYTYTQTQDNNINTNPSNKKLTLSLTQLKQSQRIYKSSIKQIHHENSQKYINSNIKTVQKETLFNDIPKIHKLSHSKNKRNTIIGNSFTNDNKYF